MKLPKLLCLGLFAVTGITLAGCSPASDASEGSDYSSKPCTVIYYDDAATPQKIGYSYVKPGASALFPVHNSTDGAYPEGYDYLSRATALPVDAENSNRPMRLSFDTFAGKYEDGSDVDLYDIKGDCNVYATFTKAPATYTYTIQNGNATATYTDGSEKVAYEKSADFPTLPVLPADGELSATDTLTDSTLSWFEEDTFEGYTLSSSGKDVAGTAVEVTTTAVIASTASLTYDDLGSEKGNAADKALHFWVDTAYDSTNKCYPLNLYYSDGTNWNLLGALINDLNLTFHVKYSEKTSKVFTAKVYASEFDAKHGGTPVVEDLQVEYLETITAGTPVLNGTVYETVLTGESGKTVTTAFEPESWAGFYTGSGDFAGDAFTFSSGVSSGIQDDCSIYPVKKLRVHVYDSVTNYTGASALLLDSDSTNDEHLEYPEQMYVNYSGEITYEIVGDIAVLNTSLGITRLRFDNSSLDPTNINGFVCYNALGKSDGSDFTIGTAESDEVAASITAECYLYPTYGA